MVASWSSSRSLVCALVPFLSLCLFSYRSASPLVCIRLLCVMSHRLQSITKGNETKRQQRAGPKRRWNITRSSKQSAKEIKRQVDSVCYHPKKISTLMAWNTVGDKTIISQFALIRFGVGMYVPVATDILATFIRFTQILINNSNWLIHILFQNKREDRPLAHAHERERDQKSERTGEDEMRKNSSINFVFISRARVCNLGTVCIFLSQDQSENWVCECNIFDIPTWAETGLEWRKCTMHFTICMTFISLLERLILLMYQLSKSFGSSYNPLSS